MPTKQAVPTEQETPKRESSKKGKSLKRDEEKTEGTPRTPLENRSTQETAKQDSTKKGKGNVPSKYKKTPEGDPLIPQASRSTQEDARDTVSVSHRQKRGRAPKSAFITLQSSPEAEDARVRKGESNAARQLFVSGPGDSSASVSQSNHDTFHYEALSYDRPNYPSSSSSVTQPSLPKPRTADNNNNLNDNERAAASIRFPLPDISDTERPVAAPRRLEVVPLTVTEQDVAEQDVTEQDAIDYEVIAAALTIIHATNRRRAMHGLPPLSVRTEEADLNGEGTGRKWKGNGEAD